MRLWLSHSSEVSLREQLVTQIRLGIISGDLKVGQKLPSTRELAQRFHLHANTVSAAYRELHRRGWVQLRKGSGVYVRKLNAEAKLEGSLRLDQLVAQFFKTARENGFSLNEIRLRVEAWVNHQPPDHFLVIDPDLELRRILIAEIEFATGARVRGASIDDCRDGSVLTGAAPVAMYSQAESVGAILPLGTDLIILRSRSVPESLVGQTRPADDALIRVISRWSAFLHWSRAILIAAGLDPNSMDFRDAREHGWKRGLGSTGLVIADSLIASQLPASVDVRLFRIISDASLDELRAFVERSFK